MAGPDGGGGPGAGSVWRWDVALSFAGAQRAYVEQVAEVLKARGVRCFYAADEQIELWGKYLAEELPAIYGEQAAVVVVVSAEYATRDWTRLERRAALARAVRERRECVLPARFDDTPLPGLLSDLVAVDLRTRSPQQFAAMIVGKLAALAIAASGPSATAGEPAQPEGNSARAATQTVPTPIRIDRLRAIDLLGDAERVAQSITDTAARAPALATIATALAATDPDRAERVAQSITDKEMRAPALATIATALAATDPDRAERVAQSITDKEMRAPALATIATALAATDPDRAARLIADAERVARSITSESPRAQALADVAAVLAATDPDRAERVARSITSESSWALVDVAAALAATDPDLAELVARSITSESSRVLALATIAKVLAANDPDRAERVARSITSESSRVRALVDVAAVLAATDPDRAARLIADAEHVARSITDNRDARLITNAEHVFLPPFAVTRRSITDKESQASALATIAKALAATDPDRAERVARSITDKESQASALVSIARIGLQGL